MSSYQDFTFNCDTCCSGGMRNTVENHVQEQNPKNLQTGCWRSTGKKCVNKRDLIHLTMKVFLQGLDTISFKQLKL